MSFTSRLGTDASQLANIELETVGTSSQSLQIKANILNTTARTFTAKAHIVTGQSLQIKANIKAIPTIQLKASIFNTVTKTFSAKAHIVNLASLQLKANILITVTSDLEVDFKVVQPLEIRLPINYNVGDAVVTPQFFTAKANIVLPISNTLSVTYEIDYTMPTICAVRPTQRVDVRSRRTFSARARIRGN